MKTCKKHNFTNQPTLCKLLAIAIFVGASTSASSQIMAEQNYVVNNSLESEPDKIIKNSCKLINFSERVREENKSKIDQICNQYFESHQKLTKMELEVDGQIDNIMRDSKNNILIKPTTNEEYYSWAEKYLAPNFKAHIICNAATYPVSEYYGSTIRLILDEEIDYIIKQAVINYTRKEHEKYNQKSHLVKNFSLPYCAGLRSDVLYQSNTNEIIVVGIADYDHPIPENSHNELSAYVKKIIGNNPVRPTILKKQNELQQLRNLVKFERVEIELSIKKLAELELAYSKGFSTLEEYKNALSLGANTPSELALINFANDIKTTKQKAQILMKYGVTGISDYNSVIEKGKSIGYFGSNEVPVEELFQYFDDLKETTETPGATVISIREERFRTQEKERELARQESLRRAELFAAEERKRNLAFAKEHPYIAILSCGLNNHMAIFGCFIGRRDVDTELKIRNGNSVMLYKSYNIKDAGRERQDGLHIDLKRGFSITAQNASENLILGLKIIDRVSGKTLYQDKAGQYGVVSSRN